MYVDEIGNKAEEKHSRCPLGLRNIDQEGTSARVIQDREERLSFIPTILDTKISLEFIISSKALG